MSKRKSHNRPNKGFKIVCPKESQPETQSNVIPSYTCSPHCTYFPNMDCKFGEWYTDSEGIKRRNDGKTFVCGYDGHTIISWFDPCPKDEDLKMFLD